MITIRPTIKNDVNKLCELQKSAFFPIYQQYHDAGNPYLRGAEDILCRLDSPTFKYFTILDDGEIVGGVLYRCEGNTPFTKLQEGEYYLVRIYVQPNRQGLGIGKTAILLCEKEFNNATKFYVDFPKGLNKNRKCYESAGFYGNGQYLEVESGLVLLAYEKNVVSQDVEKTIINA